MGLDFQLEVPSTVDEYNTLAKDLNACLSEAILNVVYRSTLPDIRTRFITALEAATGIKFPTIKNDKGEEVYDPKMSDGKFVDGVRDKKGWQEPEAWKSAATPILLSAIQGDPKAVDTEGKPDEDARKPVVFDPTATAKGPSKPKTLPKDYLDAATRVFANNNQNKIVDRIKADSDGTITVVFDPMPKLQKGHKESEEAHAKAVQANIVKLGWAIRANELYLSKKRQTSYA